MMNEYSIKKISGKAVYVGGNDIDTDRIIPARFMKCVTFEGLGQYAFYDVRFDEQGRSKHHVLDRPEHQGASILVVDQNFGCGSSREHAPQALAKFGFKAIIGGSFAEIFFGNCATMGIPCVTLEDGQRAQLVKSIQENPQAKLMLDLENLEIKIDETKFKVNLPTSIQQSFLSGKYDPLFELLEGQKQVNDVAKKLGYVD